MHVVFVAEQARAELPEEPCHVCQRGATWLPCDQGPFLDVQQRTHCHIVATCKKNTAIAHLPAWHMPSKASVYHPNVLQSAHI